MVSLRECNLPTFFPGKLGNAHLAKLPSPRSRTRRFSSNPKSCTRPTNLGPSELSGGHGEVVGCCW